MTSPDLVAGHVEKLADLFPQVVTESADDNGHITRAIDFDQLRQELSNNLVEGPKERFRLEWPGKRAAALAANAPIAKALRPVREDSVNFDTTENLFIEGDNLEALKLLQESYLGKVKLIYIDPPYNTGRDFVYNDDFAESTEEYLKRSGQVTDEGERLVANPESNGRFHSDWLSMIYPRLRLARNLLKEDGVLVVSIDDDELPRMRQVLDEIFGSKNFYACVTWKKKYSPANDAKKFSDVHDYLLFYARSESFSRNLFPRTAENNKPYKYDDGDGRGPYRTGDLSVRTYNAANDFPIVNPNTGEEYYPPNGRCWGTSREGMQRMGGDNRIFWGKDGRGAPQLKRYLSEVQQGTVPITVWAHDFAGHTDNARKEIRALFGTTAVFDTPKPTQLLRRVIEVSTENGGDDIVMDFFAGSGTTAHAVISKNAEDGGNRKFILVQVAEELQAKNVSDYDTVADVSRERIRRAGRKIEQDFAEQLEGREQPLDVGFRSLRIDSTNMIDVLATPDDVSQANLFESVSNVKADRTGEDLLFQVLLDWGLPLDVAVEAETIEGQECFVVESGALIACFEPSVSAETVRGIAQRDPVRAVFRDEGFASDAERINAEQVFKEFAPAADVKVI